MILNNFFIDSPIGWILISSLFSAAALSKAIIRIKKDAAADNAKNRKWVMVCLLISFALVSAMCALYFPGPEKINDIKFLSLFLAATAVFFPGFRFKKAAGFPLFLVLGFTGVVLVLFFQPFTPVNGKTGIGTVYVLSASENKTTMEIVLSSGSSSIVEMEGDYFYPDIDVITIHDALAFSGVKTWYCFTKIESFTKGEKPDEFLLRQSVEIKKVREISASLFSFFENNQRFFPIIKKEMRKILPEKARELKRFAIIIQDNGGISIELKE